MSSKQVDMTGFGPAFSFSMEEDESLEDADGGLEDFEVTLRIHDAKSATPDQSDGRLLADLDLEDNNHLPHIAVTPMTPGGGSPGDGHSTVSLNSSCTGSPMFQPRMGLMTNNTNNAIMDGDLDLANAWTRSESPMQPQNEVEAKDFFAYRDSILNHVISEVHQSIISPTTDGNVKGTWLLTEIDSWNHEWERIVILCHKNIVIVKYDFIGMKIEDTRRLELGVIDKVIQGDLVYPQNSLTPKINGIAEGIAGVVKDCIIPTVHGTVSSVGCAVWRKGAGRCTSLEQGIEATEDNNVPPLVENPTLKPTTNSVVEGESGADTTNKQDRSFRGTIMSALSLEKFESKTRKSQGIQIIWMENQPLSFHQKWNPFLMNSIPRLTFTSHPLFWHKGGGGSVSFFEIEQFVHELLSALGQGSDDLSPSCRIEYKPIVIESYVGIASLLHNANSLGFYKVRGKVSF